MDLISKIKEIYQFIFPKLQLFVIWIPNRNDYYRDNEGNILKLRLELIEVLKNIVLSNEPIIISFVDDI